jgi:hypothetical protein
MIYQLSDNGRHVTLAEWKRIGGCGLPGDTGCYRKLGPPAKFDHNALTLGQIEDACAYTGRSLARFAVEHLNKPEMAKPYESALCS